MTVKEKTFAEVDWKCSSEDVLYAVRAAYKKKLPFLTEKNFDELSENYATEQIDNYIDALGQEISVYGYLLYEVEADGDCYLFAVISSEDEAEFKEVLNAKQKAGTLRKQARRKPGEAAKRMKFKKRISYQKFFMQEGYQQLFLTPCMDEKIWLECTGDWDDVNRRYDAAILDLSQWEPIQSKDVGFDVTSVTQSEDGSYIAIVSDNTTDENGRLINRTARVIRGTDIEHMKDWMCIYDEGKRDILHTILDLICFENQLFLANGGVMFRIKDIDRPQTVMEKVFARECGGGDAFYYDLFVVGNQLYMFLEKTMYRWEREQEKFEIIYTLKSDAYSAEGFVPLGDKEVVFQMRPSRYFPDDNQGGTLTVLNLETMEEKIYNCQYGNIQKWGENRICVLQSYAMSKKPIIECFDFRKQEKRCLMAGAVGKAGICDIFETKAGTILRNSKQEYCKVENLWAIMEKCETDICSTTCSRD